MSVPTVWLCKDNDELISHCSCDEAIGDLLRPWQLDCPWCGCGWLFPCERCHKAFTFARAVPVSVEWMTVMLSSCPRGDRSRLEERLAALEVGRQYVYLDGVYVPADAGMLWVEGTKKTHWLEAVPHVQALPDRSLLTHTLENPSYWRPEGDTGEDLS